MSASLFWGIDCGSSEIKVVLLDRDGKLVGRAKRRTLFPLIDHVRAALRGDPSLPDPFGADGRTPAPGHHFTATGYGRAHLPFVQEKLTEIKAHFLGVERSLGERVPRELYAIVDIGGQDSKVIHARAGQVQQFVINRKCAAGTGAYIEELAHRLQLDPAELTALAARHDRELVLNSYCTVFAGQEVIRVLMNGEKVENLIHALYQSVVQRVLEMTTIQGGAIVFSGGVMSHHAALIELFRDKFPGRAMILAPDAQYSGALGAAVYGLSGGEKP